MNFIQEIEIEEMNEQEQEWLAIYPLQPTDYEKQGSIWPLRIGANIAKPNYHIGPRVTQYYYLLCVLEGEGTFIHQKKHYPLRANDIFCLFPQVIHEYYCNPNKPVKKLILAFDGKLALATLARLGLTPEQPHMSGRVTSHTIAAFLRMFQQHGQPLARLNGMYAIFRSLELNSEVPLSQSSSVDWLEKGKQYIEHHFSEAITVEQIAQLVGVERTHFSKMYRKAYGLSPIDFLLQLRMQEAELLLVHTSYKIIEIAQAVGYQDISSFSKAFKKRVGMSPIAYRERSQRALIMGNGD